MFFATPSLLYGVKFGIVRGGDFGPKLLCVNRSTRGGGVHSHELFHSVPERFASDDQKNFPTSFMAPCLPFVCMSHHITRSLVPY